MSPQSLVTEAHVREALAVDKGTTAQLTSWSVVDFTKQGDNYACFVSSVRVKFLLDGQSSEVVYVVKLNPCRNFESMREFTQNVFEKESKFYLSLLPELNSVLNEIGLRDLKFPKCPYASLEKYKEIIFLEDLRPRGFKMFDRKKGMDKAHIALLMQELARLHAASILLQAKTPDEDLTVRYSCLKKGWAYFFNNSETLLKVLESQVKNSREMLIKFGGYERAVTWIDTIILPRLVEIFEEQMENNKYKVVGHGDCWNNNILFR